MSEHTNWDRQNVSTGTPWESIVGYSRAVRVGPMVFVTGTLAADTEGNISHHGDAYGQTMAIFDKIEAALKTCGATMNDVVRTRIFVTDIDHLEAIGKAHKQRLGDIMPATTMVEVTRLASDDALLEIEADAVRQDN